MRLLLKLKSIKTCSYEMNYHYYLQGFIYNLLKGSKFEYLHNKNGYKFFCFSNIFPVKTNIKNGEFRNLIISSPDSDFIFLLEKSIKSLFDNSVIFGSMEFKIEYVKIIDTVIHSNSDFNLITGTPIMIRIQREKYQQFGVHPSKDYPYIFWKSDHPIELFVSSLKNNLLKKYREFYNDDDICNNEDTNKAYKEFFLFQKFRFKKQVSIKIIMKGVEQIVIGTLWEFEFEGWQNNRLVKFALDAGLGERNSLGFGFMNLITK
jgi:CRISPR-associated endoribonuclease Cas6